MSDTYDADAIARFDQTRQELVEEVKRARRGVIVFTFDESGQDFRAGCAILAALDHEVMWAWDEAHSVCCREFKKAYRRMREADGEGGGL